VRIGITGGSGFIGSLLVQRHLDLGNEVHLLSRKTGNSLENVHLHKGNLLDVNSLNSFVKDIDVLYHCAAEIRDESKMQSLHIEGTKNLIKVASGKIKHWVQLSSVGVYGPVYEGIIKESQVYNPINIYEKTKLESDLLVLESSRNKHFTSTIIRPSNVFGVNMNNQSLYELVKTVDKGLYFFIGKKGASANYVPVKNVVESLCLAATNLKAVNQIYNISSWCTMEDFIKLISFHLKKPMPKYRIPIKPIVFVAKITSFIPKNPISVARVLALCNRSIYSIEKIENELNYKPISSFHDEIFEIVNKYNEENE
jgi:nucleoside-diphosphate-sugar epimerase|tara:strand:- start:5884 stop:6819 length:936 start_codon:yes stop_codon:yes gene_type:complete